jgi:ribosomal protein L10
MKLVNTAKIIYKFKRKISHMKVVGGFIGKKQITQEYAKYLSEIPDLNVLQFKLLNMISGILIRVLNIINYQPLMIINILKNK